MARADQFERSWHLAAWVPNDPEAPTVLINVDRRSLKRSSPITKRNTQTYMPSKLLGLSAKFLESLLHAKLPIRKNSRKK